MQNARLVLSNSVLHYTLFLAQYGYIRGMNHGLEPGLTIRYIEICVRLQIWQNKYVHVVLEKVGESGV